MHSCLGTGWIDRCILILIPVFLTKGIRRVGQQSLLSVANEQGSLLVSSDYQCPHWQIMNGPLVTSFDTFSKPVISLLWSLMCLTQRRSVVNEFYKVQHVINNIKQMRWCHFIHPSSVNRCLYLNQKCGGGVGCIMSLRLKNVSVKK